MNISDENNQYEFQDEEQMPRGKKSKNFYIALTLCIAAVSIACWSTYESVKSFVSPVNNTSVHHKKTQTSESDNSGLSKTGKRKVLEIDGTPKPDTTSNQNDKEKNKPNKNEDSNEIEEETQAVSGQASNSPIVYPSSKNIIKEFSGENPVYSKTLCDWRIHQGADFKSDEGESVKSISDGTVSDIYNDEAYGNTIVIDHDQGFTAYYCGLGETSAVTKGQKVKSGDNIGSIKSVPCELLDGPHLHLMILKDKKFIDPMLILDYNQ